MFTVACEHAGSGESRNIHLAPALRHLHRPVLCSYLEFLPPDGLHVGLLAYDEGVGGLVAFWVDVGPAEGVAVLGDLCDHLVVTASLHDVSGDTWCRAEGKERTVSVAQANLDNQRRQK